MNKILLIIFLLTVSLFNIFCDEWDIFNKESQADSVDNLFSNEFKSGLKIKYLYAWKNDSLLNDLTAAEINPDIIKINYNLFYNLKMGNLLKLISNMQITVSNENNIKYKDIIKDYESLSFYHIGINDMYFDFNINKAVFFSVGLLSTKIGNSLIFNPVNFVNRYVSDPAIPGAYCFPSFKLSFPYPGNNWFVLQFIPYFEKINTELSKKSYISFFQSNYKSNILALQSNHFIFDNSLSIDLFIEDAKPWTLKQLNFGFGGEVQIPIFEFLIFEAQGLYSNGYPPFTVDEIKSNLEYGYISLNEDMADNYYFNFIITLKSTILSILNINFSYLYNQRGISYSGWSKIYSTLNIFMKDKDNSFNTILDSFSGLEYSPVPFLQHLLLLTIGVPGITENLGADITGFFSIQNFSSQLILNIFYNFNDSISFNIEGSLNIGSYESPFKFISKNTIGGSIDFNF